MISTDLERRFEGRLEAASCARGLGLDLGVVSDAELDRRLGPLDEQWLEHVLSDREEHNWRCKAAKLCPLHSGINQA